MQLPLKDIEFIPVPPHSGAFGVRRKHHTHEGVDLYCGDQTPVYAMESGLVVWVGVFTGEEIGTGWWNTTYAVAIQHSFGVLFYGELYFPFLNVGDRLGEGDEVGYVRQVLKKDKGKPMSMLHLELYSVLPEILPPVLWTKARPEHLIDITSILVKLREDTSLIGEYILNRDDGWLNGTQSERWILEGREAFTDRGV